jgi:hypothetical protein
MRDARSSLSLRVTLHDSPAILTGTVAVSFRVGSIRRGRLGLVLVRLEDEVLPLLESPCIGEVRASAGLWSAISAGFLPLLLTSINAV